MFAVSTYWAYVWRGVLKRGGDLSSAKQKHSTTFFSLRFLLCVRGISRPDKKRPARVPGVSSAILSILASLPATHAGRRHSVTDCSYARDGTSVQGSLVLIGRPLIIYDRHGKWTLGWQVTRFFFLSGAFFFFLFFDN